MVPAEIGYADFRPTGEAVVGALCALQGMSASDPSLGEVKDSFELREASIERQNQKHGKWFGF